MWNILKDQRGIDPMTAGALVLGGSSLLGGLFGKKKRKEEIYDPYAKLRGQYQEYAGQQLGRQTPYQYKPEFETAQPEVEAEAEKTILGQLREPKKPSAYAEDITGKHYAARTARMGERHQTEQKELQDMYNRLGLVSSTPGLQAATELRTTQGQELEDVSSQLMYEDIQREMQAEMLADQMAQSYLGQAQVLGGAQRGYAQKPMEMSMQDVQRRVQEEQGWAQPVGQILGGTQPERTVTETPNIWSQLAGVGTDIGSQLMIQNILGRRKT